MAELGQWPCQMQRKLGHQPGMSCPEQLGVPAFTVGLGIFLPMVALTSALTFPASASGNRMVALTPLRLDVAV